MILIGVLMGYILGVAPFIMPKFYEAMLNKKKSVKEENITKQEEEILDEWLNGPKDKQEEKGNNVANQQDIFNEYMTGIPTPKGD